MDFTRFKARRHIGERYMVSESFGYVFYF
jgi:hypothetical protein